MNLIRFYTQDHHPTSVRCSTFGIFFGRGRQRGGERGRQRGYRGRKGGQLEER